MTHVTRDPHLEVERSKVKVARLINAVTENQPYLGNGKASAKLKLGIRMKYTMTRITDMRSDLHNLKALGDCSSHHSKGDRGILWRPHYRFL